MSYTKLKSHDANLHDAICSNNLLRTEEKNQVLVGGIPFCGEHPGPRFEDKFLSANQMGEISKAGGDKLAAS